MDTPPPDERVGAVVALKTLPGAKSRMISLPPPVRERLARCMALDTLSALAPVVDELLVISDQPDLPVALARHGLPARVVAEPGVSAGVSAAMSPGDALNRALAYGDEVLRTMGVSRVLACVGDLPALRSSTLARLLAAAPRQGRSFLADHDARGTTVLIGDGLPLEPLFGTDLVAGRLTGSAERHRSSGAVALPVDGTADARWDVDTVDDLRIAADLGLGPATAAMLDPTSTAVGSYVPVTVVRPATDTAITIALDGRGETVDWSAYDGDPALIVPGRRLHAVRVGAALHCWV